MKKIILIFLFLFSYTILVNAQTLTVDENGVAINEDETGASSGAILDINSNSKGLLIPRLKEGAVSDPVKGLLIYDDGVHKFKYYNGEAWTEILNSQDNKFTEGQDVNQILFGGKMRLGSTSNTAIAHPLEIIGNFNLEDPGLNADLKFFIHNKAAIATYNTRNGLNNVLYLNRDWSRSESYHSDFDFIALFGAVGIGKNDPSERLDVNGNVKANGFIGPKGLIKSGKFGDGATTTTDAVFPVGRVGIGTDNPYSTLHVKGNAGLLNLEGIDHAYIQFYKKSIGQGRSGYLGYGSSASNAFYITNTIGNILLNGGNVGIGYTSPNEKLEVKGKVRADGFVLSNGKVIRSADIDANYCFAVGESLMSNKGGKYNFAVGERCLVNNISGSYNIAFGYESLARNIDGSHNIAMGEGVLTGLAKGGNNIAFGKNALSGIGFANYNIAIGESVLAACKEGDHNIALGYHAGLETEHGSRNIFIGYEAGRYASGDDILFIGNDPKQALIYGDLMGNHLGINAPWMDKFALNVGGDAIANHWISGSDVRWKTNVNDIDNAMAIINQMRGVRFEWKIAEFPNKAFSEGIEVGLIAQEVETVVPEVVYTNSEGYKSVDYSKLVSVLIQAVKEQQVEIEALKLQQSQIETLKSQIETIQNALDQLDQVTPVQE